jgi:hypothetical protein
MLDMEANSLDHIADLILDNMISAGHLDASGRDKVREALLRRHRHLHEKGNKNSGANSSSSNMSRLPIIRSLAEIGKSHSSSKSKLMSFIFIYFNKVILTSYEYDYYYKQGLVRNKLLKKKLANAMSLVISWLIGKYAKM